MTNLELLKRICDRSAGINDVIQTLRDYWRYDLYTRHPGPAYFEDGQLVMTDLDLACFMSALAERHAVINLPTYKRRRAKTVREGEHVVSATNRHGQIVGLVANQESFAFGVLINDANVMTAGGGGADGIGAYRNFLLTNLDGKFWEGWDRIEFLPTAKENDFLTDRKLWTGHTLYFQNFVHPNRWISLYGSYYFLTKALIQRLEEESTFLRTERKRLTALGYGGNGHGEAAAPATKKTTLKEESVPTKITAFQAEVDVPMSGAFMPQDNLANVSRLLKQYADALSALRFAARASELAFAKYHGEDRRPGWLKTAAWEDGYVQPGKRIKWRRLVVKDLRPEGQDFDLAIRYRLWTKTERIAPGSPAPQLTI